MLLTICLRLQCPDYNVWSFTSVAFRYNRGLAINHGATVNWITGNVWSFTSTNMWYRGMAVKHGGAVNWSTGNVWSFASTNLWYRGMAVNHGGAVNRSTGNVWSSASTNLRYHRGMAVDHGAAVNWSTGNVWSFTSTAFRYRDMDINYGESLNWITVNCGFKLRNKFRNTTRRGGQNGAEKNWKWTTSAEERKKRSAVNKEGGHLDRRKEINVETYN